MPPLKQTKAAPQPSKAGAKSPEQRTMEQLQANPQLIAQLVEDANRWRELTGGGRQLALGNLEPGTRFVMGTVAGILLDRNSCSAKVEVMRDDKSQTIEWSLATPVSLVREPSLLPVSQPQAKNKQPEEKPQLKFRATAPPPPAASIFDD